MDNLEQKLINLLDEKYKPIMVIYLMGIPDDADYMHDFAKQIQTTFGYKVLILPGNIENKVELVSILSSEEKTVDSLQKEIFDLLDEFKKTVTEPKS